MGQVSVGERDESTPSRRGTLGRRRLVNASYVEVRLERQQPRVPREH